MKLQEAKDYINYGIKEDIYDPEMFVDMTDAKLIKFAEHEIERADAYYNSHKDE